MRNLKNIHQYDAITGELLEGVMIYCGVKCNPYTTGWVMNSQEAMMIIARDKDLTRDALRIFIEVCGRLDFQNWVKISQVELSKELDIHKVNVSKAIKLLVTKGILLQGQKIGRSFEYRLNPDYGWKGKVKNLNEYRKELEEEEKLKMKRNYLRSYQSNDMD